MEPGEDPMRLQDFSREEPSYSNPDEKKPQRYPTNSLNYDPINTQRTEVPLVREPPTKHAPTGVRGKDPNYGDDFGGKGGCGYRNK